MNAPPKSVEARDRIRRILTEYGEDVVAAATKAEASAS